MFNTGSTWFKLIMKETYLYIEYYATMSKYLLTIHLISYLNFFQGFHWYRFKSLSFMSIILTMLTKLLFGHISKRIFCVKMCMKRNKLKVTFPKLLLQLIDCHSNYDICNFANGFPLINQKDTHWIHSWDLCVVLCRTCVRCTWITFNYYLHLRFK